MHQQPNPASLLWRYRRELALGLLLVGSAAVLVLLTPPLLALVALERNRRSRRRQSTGRNILQLLVRAVAWTWRKLLQVPRHGWHPCEQCGYPIEPPSTARFCSPACRRYARLRRQATAGDERAAARYEWLRRSAHLDPTLNEIPF